MLHEGMQSATTGTLVRTASVRDPDISVVVPTYNRSTIVLQSVQTVLGLEEANFEIVAVDDGSSDRTVEALATLGHPRVSVISLPKNYGAGLARNAGIAAARAPVIAFLDSDDLYLAGRLQLPLSLLRNRPGVGIVMSAFTTEKQAKRTLYSMPCRLHRGAELERLVARHILQPTTSGLTLRRELLIAVGGFDAGLRWMEDRDLVMRAARHADGATINQPLWHKRWQPDGISSNHATYFPSLLTFLNKHPIYSHQELMFRNYLIARHLVKIALHFGVSVAMRDYQEALRRFSPRLPPLPMLLFSYFRARKSRRAQQSKLFQTGGHYDGEKNGDCLAAH